MTIQHSQNPRRLSRVALMVLLGLSASCFRDPQLAKITCTNDDSCPTGYYCAVPNQPGGCHQISPLPDGGHQDAVSAPDSSSPVEAGGGDLRFASDVAADAGSPGPDSLVAPPDTASTGPEVTESVPDAAVDVPVGVPDTGAGTANLGDPCGVEIGCAQGSCVDGLCCDKPCAGIRGPP